MEEQFESELFDIIHNISSVPFPEDALEISSPFNSESLFRDDSYAEMPMKESTPDANSNKKVKTASSIRKQTLSKRKYSKKDSQTRLSKGKWNLYEEHRYFQFTKQNAAQHPSWKKKVSHDKKRMNYFVEMSAYIGTRTSDQCKSHDQKMRRKFIRDDETFVSGGESSTSREAAPAFGNRFDSEFSLEESPIQKESQLVTPSTRKPLFEYQAIINNVEGHLNFAERKFNNEDSDATPKIPNQIYQEMSCMPQIPSNQDSEELYSLVQVVRKRLLQVGGGMLNN